MIIISFIFTILTKNIIALFWCTYLLISSNFWLLEISISFRICFVRLLLFWTFPASNSTNLPSQYLTILVILPIYINTNIILKNDIITLILKMNIENYLRKNRYIGGWGPPSFAGNCLLNPSQMLFVRTGNFATDTTSGILPHWDERYWWYLIKFLSPLNFASISSWMVFRANWNLSDGTRGMAHTIDSRLLYFSVLGISIAFHLRVHAYNKVK